MYTQKEYTANMDAVIIRVIDLPPGVKGMTVKDEEGDYNIYLNGRLSNDQRVEAFRHELDHIKFGHFYSNSPVSVKERETNTRRK